MTIGHRTHRLGVLVAITALLLFAAPAAWADIYWTNSGNGTIGRAYPDGTGVNQSFINDPFSTPFGVTVDSSHIYWGNGATLIGRANLDGSAVNNAFVIGAASGLPQQGDNGVAVDASFVYWTNCCGTPSIGRAPIANPAAANPNFITHSATDPNLVAPLQVAVDPAHGHIYWADNDISAGVVMANLTDGSGEHIVVPNISANGIAVGADHIYWSTSTGTIGEANLDGSNPRAIITGLASPGQVAVDSNYVYWSDPSTNSIGRAPLNNPAAANPRFITGADAPFGLAVDSGAPPANTRGPSISGFAVASGVLSEGHGNWTNNPSGFSYQWESCDPAGNHCVPIPGATSQTYTEQAVDVGTTIRVEETAVNTFGTSLTATSDATGVVQVPGTFLTGVSTSGATASLTLSCHGPQPCDGAVTLTSHERKRGNKPLGVSASRRKRVKTVALTLGRATFSLSVGQSETLRVPLTNTGKGLLGTFYTLPTTASFSGVSIPARTITFSYPVITSPVFFTVVFFPSFTTFHSLTVKSLPRGAIVQMSCRGRGCRFAHRTLRPHRTSVNLTPFVGGARLSPRTVLQIEITATNEVGKVQDYRIVSDASPVVGTACLPPGAHRPEVCR